MMKQLLHSIWIRTALVFLGFTLVALLASKQMAGQACILEGKEIRYYQFFPINMIYFFSWGFLFLILRRLCLWLQEHVTKWFLTVLAHIFMGVVFTAVHLMMVFSLIQLGVRYRLITAGLDYGMLTISYRWMNSDFFIYIVIAGFLHFFYYYRQQREKDLRTSQLETELIQVQLQSLKTQLHPHFLFNALNTISAYVKKNPDTAIKMTARLSDLLRLTLETKTRQEIPLEEELKIANNYLEIEKLRFADRLEVILDIAPETKSIPVPVMMLQTLAENAIRHGISQKVDKGMVSISAGITEGNLEITVCDDGPGMNDYCGLEGIANGIGLKNISERLKKLYGDRSRLDIKTGDNKGFKVTVIIPVK